MDYCACAGVGEERKSPDSDCLWENFLGVRRLSAELFLRESEFVCV